MYTFVAKVWAWVGVGLELGYNRIQGDISPVLLHLVERREGLSGELGMWCFGGRHGPLSAHGDALTCMPHDLCWTCCVLQGPGTDPAMVQTIRDAIKSSDEITVRILNYKHNGTPFWNMFTLAPMKDSDGTIRFLVGVQVGAVLECPSAHDGTWRFPSGWVSTAALHGLLHAVKTGVLAPRCLVCSPVSVL